jgi:hypothetical protein
MRKAESSSVIDMQQYVEHPTEETLERFLLHQMQEEELESMETHILACDSCVARLEEMEVQIAATKMALAELHKETVAENYAKQSHSRWSWLKSHSWSLAGATAALALAITVVPRFAGVSPFETEVSAYRGSETTTIPAGRPLLLHLNAKDLPAEPVRVEIVNADGSQVWKSNNVINHDKVDAKLPEIKNKGNYLLRLYATGKNGAPGDLLREFSFDVK